MGMTAFEKVEFLSYQRKGVAQIVSNLWKEENTIDMGPLDLEKFNVAVLYRLFSLEMREAKVLDFIYLCKRNMSGKEYV